MSELLRDYLYTFEQEDMAKLMAVLGQERKEGRVVKGG